MRQSIIAVLVLMALSVQGATAECPTIRKNASLPEAANDLSSLTTAMAAMRLLPCDNPLSWYYQGAMHWVPDDAQDGSAIAPAAVLCPSYDGTPQTLKQAWDNCTHSQGTELHFLLWHRLYIYHLELIVKDQSNNPNFALPYWDYTNTSYRVMPGAFRNPSESLYEAARLPLLNAGQAIEAKMDPFLDTTKLMQYQTYRLFNQNIDAAPHGAMHDYIGGAADGFTTQNEIYQNEQAGLMSLVPSAAFDPIFWAHHSNIDFLWQQWMNSPNGAMPILSELEASPIPYQFFDPQGNLVTYTVEEAYNAAFNLPVTYDVFGSECMPSKDEFDGKGRKSTFSLDMALTRKAPAAEKEERIIMNLLVSFPEEPDGLFSVYVSNSAEQVLESAEQLAGHMTFFGARHHASHHPTHKGAEDAHGGKLTKQFAFDVTDELDPNALDGKVNVHIRKVGDEDDTDELTIEEITFTVE